MNTIPIEDSYDVVIIGSGIAGLTSGALLAKKGKKVLITEQHDKVGGYAHGFVRHNIPFNSSVHFTGGWEKMADPRKGVIFSTLDLLEAGDYCSFAPLNPFMRIINPDITIDIPSGIDAFTKTLTDISPGEETKIRELIKTSLTISNQIRRLPQKPNIIDYMLMPLRFPHLCRFGNKTLKDVLDEMFDNNTIKQMLGFLCLCFGTPISRVSFAFWTHLLQSFIEERAGYCVGTFQNFADALAKSFTNNKSTIALKTLTTKVIVNNSRVSGVLLEDGRCIKSEVVISNADLLTTYSKLIEPNKLTKRFLGKVQTMRPSVSVFSVFMVTDFNVSTLNAAPFSVVLPSSDLSPFCDYDKEPDIRPFFLSIPSLLNSSSQLKSNHGITMMTVHPYNIPISEENRQSMTEQMISRLFGIYPQLEGHIVHKESSIPETYARYTLNQGGSMIGWEYAPDQVGFKRPPIESPLKGLYHAGHWTRPGGGMYGATISGRHVAQVVLGYKDQKSFVCSFKNT